MSRRYGLMFMFFCALTLILPRTAGAAAMAGLWIDLPAGVAAAPDGSITLPPDLGAEMTTAAGNGIELPPGAVIGADGAVFLPGLPAGEGAPLVIAGGNGIELPPGAGIASDGTIFLPGGAGSAVTTASGASAALPAGTKITPDGAIAVPEGGVVVNASGASGAEAVITGVVRAWPGGDFTLGASEIAAGDGTVISLAEGSIYENALPAARAAVAERRMAGGQHLIVEVRGGDGAAVTYKDGSSVRLDAGDKVRLNPDGGTEIMKAPPARPDGGEDEGASGCASASFALPVLALVPLMRRRERRV